MPLQRKVFLALILLIAAFVVVSFVVLQAVVGPTFDELESDAARADMHRAVAALQTDIENLESITADWAPWDDIYQYVRGENPAFQKSNLDRPTLDNLDLDMMAIFSTRRRYVWGHALMNGEEVPISTLGILKLDGAESDGLSSHTDKLQRTAGVVESTLGPMIISARPILRSDDSGPIAGSLVMGQLLDDERLQRLRDRTEVDFTWRPVAVDEQATIETAFATGSHEITARKVLLDIHAEPYLVLETRTRRSISAIGSRTIAAAEVFLVIAGALVCAVILVLLRTTILRPIEQMSQHIDQIRSSGDLSTQLAMPRSDEIGKLGSQFDHMTAELHKARQDLLDQSFAAGKADTAAEVMHNIRNAMTPMINGLERLGKSFRVADNLRIADATEQLADASCPSDRREKFLQYIEVSFEHIKATGADAQDDLKMVTSQARQIAGIISDQEKFANVAPLAENLDVVELLQEASHVIPRETAATVALRVDSGPQSLRVRAPRIGLLQVMGNLILNAYESIKRSGAEQGEISLTAGDEIIDDREMIRVTVRDSGAGFDTTTRDKIFRRGFTSKTADHASGLGLHWCANAVASMGGRISAESRGTGQGAEFHVLLPAAQGG